MTRNHGLGKLGVLIACFAISAAASFAQDGLTTPTPSSRQAIIEAYGKRPLSFERNMGQTDPQVKFLARGPAYNLFLTGSEAVLSLQEEPAADSSQPATIEAVEREHHAKPSRSTFLRMAFVGANPNPDVVGLEELPGKSNYLMGSDKTKWHTDIPTFAKVKYQDVYPGVDLVYYGNQRQLEYDFVIAPDADPNQIRLSFEGAKQLRVDEQTGDLLVTTENGSEVRHARPRVYQQVGSRQVEVPGGYHALDGKHAAFTLAAYDRRHALVIDPTVSFTTFLRGSDADWANGVAVDSSGNAYVTGFTDSTDFPVVNAIQPYSRGAYDAFLTKLSPTGAILFSTYWGGSEVDEAFGIAVDSTGVVISGGTFSLDFPGQHIGALNEDSPHPHVFVTKFSLTGQEIYSLLLGGSNFDAAYAIALDSAHAAYIAGYTYSPDFPTAGSWRAQPPPQSIGGGAFVAKIDASGNLVNTAFIGGSVGMGIAVDYSGSIWITGTTTDANFPLVGVGPVTFHGPEAFFVSRIYSTFDGFSFSTVFGGGSDYNDGLGPRAIAVAGDYAYVTGYVGPNSGFPTTPGAFQFAKPTPQCTPHGLFCWTAFVAAINSYGELMYATYLGGSNGDTWANAIAVHGAGVYVAGITSSTSFPGAPAITPNPAAGFLVKFTPQLNAINYTQFLGAGINGVAVFQPYSRLGRPTYPQVYTAGYRWTGANMNMDAFVVRLDETPPTLIHP